VIHRCQLVAALLSSQIVGSPRAEEPQPTNLEPILKAALAELEPTAPRTGQSDRGRARPPAFRERMRLADHTGETAVIDLAGVRYRFRVPPDLNSDLYEELSAILERELQMRGQNSPVAQTIELLFGYGRGRDVKEALALIERHASDHPVLCAVKALLLKYGYGVRKSRDAYLEALRRCSEMKEPFGTFLYIREPIAAGLAPDMSPERLADSLAFCGEEGTAYAFYLLGRLQFEGSFGLAKDRQLAFGNFAKALAVKTYIQDLPTRLFFAYYYGMGVQQDRVLGLRWLDVDLKHGYALAYSALGDLFYRGDGVRRDLVRSCACYQRAANLGGVLGMVSLGNALAKGEGTTKDIEEANKYWDLAYARGYRQHACGAAIGNFQHKNVIEGIHWLTRGVEDGCDRCRSLMLKWKVTPRPEYVEAGKWEPYKKQIKQADLKQKQIAFKTGSPTPSQLGGSPSQ